MFEKPDDAVGLLIQKYKIITIFVHWNIEGKWIADSQFPDGITMHYDNDPQIDEYLKWLRTFSAKWGSTFVNHNTLVIGKVPLDAKGRWIT